MNKRLIKQKEAAECLDLSEATLERDRWRGGDIPYIKVGQRAIRYDLDQLYAYLDGKIAKWWMPDEIIIQESLPKTSVGKFAKTELREQLKEVSNRWEESSRLESYSPVRLAVDCGVDLTLISVLHRTGR